MRNAKKTKVLLELERLIDEHPSTLLEAGRKSMSEATTVKEAIPRINQLAVLYDLKPSNVKHFKFIVKFMQLEKQINEL